MNKEVNYFSKIFKNKIIIITLLITTLCTTFKSGKNGVMMSGLYMERREPINKKSGQVGAQKFCREFLTKIFFMFSDSIAQFKIYFAFISTNVTSR